MRDAYTRFFEFFKIAPDEFFKFGLNEMIHIPLETAAKEWEHLKDRIANNETVTIRSYGRNGANSHLFTDLYQSVIGNNSIKIDKTNNDAPTKLLQDCTGYSKKTNKQECKLIRNYQVSHVFGRTKNPFAFTAPWNIVYLPKIIDPLTGHEASGELPEKFRQEFQQHVIKKFQPLIENFNQIVTDTQFLSRVQQHLLKLDCHNKKRFSQAITKELLPITMA